MNPRNFSLIEIIVFIMIFSIIAMLVVQVAIGINSGNFDGLKTPTVSFGMNGMVEERCLGGYKFIVGPQGWPQQILGTDGKGVSCF